MKQSSHLKLLSLPEPQLPVLLLLLLSLPEPQPPVSVLSLLVLHYFAPVLLSPVHQLYYLLQVLLLIHLRLAQRIKTSTVLFLLLHSSWYASLSLFRQLYATVRIIINFMLYFSNFFPCFTFLQSLIFV